MQSYTQLTVNTLQKLILYEVMTLEKTADVELKAISPSPDKCRDDATLTTYEHFTATVAVRGRDVRYGFQWNSNTENIEDVLRGDTTLDEPTDSTQNNVSNEYDDEKV